MPMSSVEDCIVLFRIIKDEDRFRRDTVQDANQVTSTRTSISTSISSTSSTRNERRRNISGSLVCTSFGTME